MEAWHQPQTDKAGGPGVSTMDDYCVLRASAVAVGCYSDPALRSPRQGRKAKTGSDGSCANRTAVAGDLGVIQTGVCHRGHGSKSTLSKVTRRLPLLVPFQVLELRTFPSRADLVLWVGTPRSTFGATAGQGQELDPWRGCRGVVREGHCQHAPAAVAAAAQASSIASDASAARKQDRGIASRLIADQDQCQLPSPARLPGRRLDADQNLARRRLFHRGSSDNGFELIEPPRPPRIRRPGTDIAGPVPPTQP